MEAASDTIRVTNTGSLCKSSQDTYSDVLLSEYYLTKGMLETPSTEMSEKNAIFKSGRPDLRHILRRFGKESGNEPVAVLTCGPSSMVEELRRLCVEESSGYCGGDGQGLRFDFHSEVFEF